MIMPATARVLGMLPMSLGLGDGGEQNAPLGRAGIGGLVFATLSTLFFVPVVLIAIGYHPPANLDEGEPDNGATSSPRPRLLRRGPAGADRASGSPPAPR